MVEVDVRGLSCPEPVMLSMDAIDENPGETIKVITNEAYSRKNIERMLKHQKIEFKTEEVEGGFEIIFQA